MLQGSSHSLRLRGHLQQGTPVLAECSAERRWTNADVSRAELSGDLSGRGGTQRTQQTMKFKVCSTWWEEKVPRSLEVKI